MSLSDMSLFRRRAGHRPDDSPDLSWMMGFVTTVGGLSAYTSKRSTAGLVAGCGLGALFGVSGALIASNKPENHEMAHQIALIGSVLFGGAMGYRAGANPYVGPGGAMLAALGGLSSAYHLTKWIEWRSYEQARIQEAERLLREHYRGLAAQQGGEARGPHGGGAAGHGPLLAAPGEGEHGVPARRGLLSGGWPGGPSLPPGGR